MIIVKFLGILDIIMAAVFWLFSFYHFIPESFVFILALIILVKGIFFMISEYFASVGDVIAGALILLSLYWALPAVLVVIITIYLLQKGIFSML